MRNIALKLMYNGTAYHGWQMQRTEAYSHLLFEIVPINKCR